MQVFKNFDYFRKTSPEHTRSTVIGGLVSILCVVCISYLTLTQVAKHQETVVSKDTYVVSDASQSQFVDMHIDLVFPNAPCFMIDFDIQNGFHTENWSTIPDDLIRNRISGESFWSLDKPYEDFEFKPSQGMVQMGGGIFMITNNGAGQQAVEANKTQGAALLAQAVKDREGCQIKGIINLRKVPGKFAFSFKSKQQILDKLVQDDKELASNVNLNHHFREFQFGDTKTRSRVEDRFKDYPEHTKFDMIGKTDRAYKEEATIDRIIDIAQPFKSTFYFMKLVPHIFNDQHHDEDFETYSYSLTSNRKAVEHQHDMKMFITFNIAPVSVMITKENPQLTKFLVNLCAIIGGVFVLFGLLNKFLLKTKASIVGKDY